MKKNKKRIIKSVSKLKIQYEAPEVILAMDMAIKKLAKLVGLKFSGSGYNFRTGMRDISYD